MKKLYFVESVKHFGDNIIVLLLYIPYNINSWILNNKDFKWFIRKTLDPKWVELVQEGTYVYALNNDEYEVAHNDPRIVQINERYNTLIDSLRKLRIIKPEFLYKNVITLYTYHINVGHGNHTLIVFKTDNNTHIWMVDCSNYDVVSHRSYNKNIDTCLNHIKQKFQLTGSIHIDVVMLTHPHYDHYSGINYYIKNKLIDNTTIVYTNLSYQRVSNNYINLLSELDKTRTSIIEPFSCYSNENIRILYPDIHNFNTRLSTNNISSVYNILFDDISYFVFPGDLETVGWNLMNVNACYPYMNLTRYYAISHHGSISGHGRNTCCMRHINNIKNCLCPHAIPILMGRDKAFSGIYAPQVLADFSGRILYSEKDNLNNPVSFLEIDLMSNIPTWY